MGTSFSHQGARSPLYELRGFAIGLTCVACLTVTQAEASSFMFFGENHGHPWFIPQLGTIQTSGTYRLELRGGNGGGAFYNPAQGANFGGRVEGTLSLTAGDEFTVLVGHNGEEGSRSTGGGGGGLSYFAFGEYLAIAGGGGGAAGGFGASGSATNPRHSGASVSMVFRDTFSGVDSLQLAASADGTAGTPGSGDQNPGHGGASWLQSDFFAVSAFATPIWWPELILSEGSETRGGFGGGGASGSQGIASGGGGGAGASGGRGGDAGFSYDFRISGIDFGPNGETTYVPGSVASSVYVAHGGEAGTSYVSDGFSDVAFFAYDSAKDYAFVSLTLLEAAPVAPVPLPASALLLGTTVLAIGAVGRRKTRAQRRM